MIAGWFLESWALYLREGGGRKEPLTGKGPATLFPQHPEPCSGVLCHMEKHAANSSIPWEPILACSHPTPPLFLLFLTIIFGGVKKWEEQLYRVQYINNSFINLLTESIHSFTYSFSLSHSLFPPLSTPTLCVCVHFS